MTSSYGYSENQRVCGRCRLPLTAPVPFCPRCGAPVNVGTAPRPTPVLPPPGLALTIIITALFGLFGLIPAAIDAGKARDRGHPTGRYWGAFVITQLATAVVGVLMAVLLYGSLMAAFLQATRDENPYGSEAAPTSYATSNDPSGTDDSSLPADETTAPTSDPTFPADVKQCSDRIGVNDVTSCKFAKNVAEAYWSTHATTLEVYSPVTKKSYTMECDSEDGLTVCRGGNNAAVYLMP